MTLRKAHTAHMCTQPDLRVKHAVHTPTYQVYTAGLPVGMGSRFILRLAWLYTAGLLEGACAQGTGIDLSPDRRRPAGMHPGSVFL